jgi:hypothetical protein
MTGACAMSRARTVLRLHAKRRCGGFARDESGATLVEFALVLALFLLLFFSLIFFGIATYTYVTAEKAVQIAARIAIVRPPVCAGVPAVNNVRGAVFHEFGTRCSVSGACGSHNSVQCRASDAAAGTPGAATVTEIWAAIAPLLPNGAMPVHLRFSYDYPAAPYKPIGFLGGPYTPIVTVELVPVGGSGPEDDLKFLAANPLSVLRGLGRLASGSDEDDAANADIDFPTISVSLPGEDLAQGM